MGENQSGPLILVAEESELSRQYIANILTPAGYQVVQAIDGGSALKVATEHKVALTIIDHNMKPFGGFEFVNKLRNNGIEMPIILVTDEQTSDLLVEATHHGIGSYLKKPVDPHRLLEAIRRALREVEPVMEERNSIATTIIKTHFLKEELIERAIYLAQRNADLKRGGPYGAVVADFEGKILGEGVNGITSRCDPVAHAEVMAIRQATERLNKTDLEGCILYSSSEPTMIGKALIDSVGISKVYYGLSHNDLKHFTTHKKFAKPVYEVLSSAENLQMLKTTLDS